MHPHVFTSLGLTTWNVSPRAVSKPIARRTNVTRCADVIASAPQIMRNKWKILFRVNVWVSSGIYAKRPRQVSRAPYIDTHLYECKAHPLLCQWRWQSAIIAERARIATTATTKCIKVPLLIALGYRVGCAYWRIDNAHSTDLTRTKRLKTQPRDRCRFYLPFSGNGSPCLDPI